MLQVLGVWVWRRRGGVDVYTARIILQLLMEEDICGYLEMDEIGMKREEMYMCLPMALWR